MDTARGTASHSALVRVFRSPLLLSQERPGLHLVLAAAWVLIGAWAIADGSLVLGLVWVLVGVATATTVAVRRLTDSR